ncbi:unnamed protein product [Ectocarpus sp. CCAP 1310/34]|nr:unnamed protein product [Ectocarpus sp. CCAP 1310/34]
MDLGDTSVFTDELLMDGGITLTGTLEPCSDCMKAKGKRASVPKGPGAWASKPLGRVHLDLCGPLAPSLGGNPYLFVAVDSASRWNKVHGLRRKSDALAATKRLLADVGRYDLGRIECFRIDNEWTRGEFRRFCADNGIGVEFTPPGVPQYNGVVESAIWRIMKAGMAARRSAARVLNVEYASITGLDPRGDRLWLESAKWAADSLNQSVTKANPGRRSPHELFTGQQGPFRVLPFFQPGYMREDRRTKLDDQATLCYYLNGGDNHPSGTVKVLKARRGGFRWYPRCADASPVHAGRLDQLRPSPDAFDRRTAAASAHAHAVARTRSWPAALCRFAVIVGDPRSWPDSFCRIAVTVGDHISSSATAVTAAAAGPRVAPALGSRHAAASPGQEGRGYEGPAAARPHDIGHEAHRRAHLDAGQEHAGIDAGGPERGRGGAQGVGGSGDRRAGGAEAGEQGGALAAVDLGAGGAGIPLACSTLLANREDIDTMLRDQRPPEQRPDLPHCQASDLRIPKSYNGAMASEYRHLWDDSMKREYFGLLEAGTFTPAKMLAALACELNLDLCHFDIEQAFLRSELEEDVLMRLPQGCGALSGLVVKLGKSLYGLRQASRQWHAMLKRCLVALGFDQCMADARVFRLIEGGGVFLILVVHVEDIFAVGEGERCDKFGADLNKSVPVKNLGELRWYYGCFYERSKETGRLTISQQTFTDELAAECTGMQRWGYADADFASKAADRRSISGGIVTCGGGVVSWFSRTQKCVTLSTTEAEYVALGDVVKEILFLRQVWRFMFPKVSMPCIPVFEDNQGAIQRAQNPISNSNSKHIDVRHHFLRELVERKEISVIHVPSPYQRADFLTKSLPKDAFESHRDFVMNLA